MLSPVTCSALPKVPGAGRGTDILLLTGTLGWKQSHHFWKELHHRLYSPLHQYELSGGEGLPSNYPVCQWLMGSGIPCGRHGGPAVALVQLGKPRLLMSVISLGMLVKVPPSGVTHTISCLPDVHFHGTRRCLVLSQLAKNLLFFVEISC